MDEETVEQRAVAGPIAEPQRAAPGVGVDSTARDNRPWYRDPPKLVGVLGFILALGTLGERFLVRENELTQRRLQELRDVTAKLADIQGEYMQALAAAPSNLYALGVAKNTKRQMYLQTADALLSHPGVKAEASSQILAALGSELMSDGRFDKAKVYFTEALTAPGADDATRPFLLRALGQLLAVPNTQSTDPVKSREYFSQAMALLDRRGDDTGRLSAVETVLTEANLEVTYGDPVKARALASDALIRLAKLRTVSPMRTQLEHIAYAMAQGEQFSQTQQNSPQAPASSHPPASVQSLPAPGSDVRTDLQPATIELWAPIQGQVSGVEMTVTVDDKPVGQLSNMKDSRVMNIGRLAPGVHRFSFANGTAYLMDPARGPSPASQGFSCGGFFELRAGGVPLKANISVGPNGVMCALQ